MKKTVLLVTIILMAFCVWAEGRTITQINLGLDTPGIHTTSEGDHDVTSTSALGISPSIELMYTVHEGYLMGIGYEYQIDREIDDNTNFPGSSPRFRFTPVYVTAKIPLRSKGEFIPEINGHVGYSFFHGDSDYDGGGNTKGGFYFAIGGGVAIQEMFIVSAMFRSQSGEVEWTNEKGKKSEMSVSQTQATIQFGIRL